MLRNPLHIKIVVDITGTIVDRLAEYEALGFTPDGLKAILQGYAQDTVPPQCFISGSLADRVKEGRFEDHEWSYADYSHK